MTKTQRPIAFVLAATNHGTMLVNRNDQKINPQGGGIGVGFEILRNSSCTQDEVDLALHLLTLRRRHFGDGVFAIDCGANIGTHTVEWARLMHGWGQVLAFEAQERIYYALAGNVTLNNCFNARVVFAAVGQTTGQILVPQPNYLAPGSYGSLEFRSSASTEDIGQPIDYRAEAALSVPLIAMDDLILSRLDLMKLDIEGDGDRGPVRGRQADPQASSDHPGGGDKIRSGCDPGFSAGAWLRGFRDWNQLSGGPHDRPVS